MSFEMVLFKLSAIKQCKMSYGEFNSFKCCTDITMWYILLLLLK